ncbi:MAG: hypothetical protein IKH57_19490 [Clostridia bacterium]|nr:hypothetical protein [Clostridia bacterium]
MSKYDDRRERQRGGSGRRMLTWLPRKIGLVVMLALAIVLASYFSPYITDWLNQVIFRIDYQKTANQLTHEMEKVGELIAVRYTDTGTLDGDIKAKLIGSVSHITVPYAYEIGLGVKLENVTLTPEETRLLVTVPDAEMLYDKFEVTGKPENKDFWGLSTQDRYQSMLNEQQAVCRQAYLDDAEKMEQAWESSCEQLKALFLQWTGESLRLEFVHTGSLTAAQE